MNPGRSRDETAGLMTLREASVYLNRPYETLRYYAFRVRLFPLYRIGVGRGRVMVKRADLDALVERGFQPAVRLVAVDGQRRAR